MRPPTTPKQAPEPRTPPQSVGKPQAALWVSTKEGGPTTAPTQRGGPGQEEDTPVSHVSIHTADTAEEARGRVMASDGPRSSVYSANA